MEGTDGTSINTNPPMYTCEVGTRSEDDIKRKRRQQKGEEEKRNTGHSVIKFVTKLKNNIKEQTLSNLAEDNLLQHKPLSFSFFQHLNPFEGLFDQLKPSFPTHSLQIHC